MPWRAQLGALENGSPAFDPWRELALRVRRDLEAGLGVPDALNLHAATAAPRFVPAQALPDGMAYEQFIFETGQCPTREGAHDFFNGLVWLLLPQAKRQLNRVQAARIAADGVGGARGPVRDAATLFDENGAVLQAPNALWDALRQRDWRRLFIDLGPLWGQARVLIFGHALLEKLLWPRKDLTAHVLAIPCPSGAVAQIDGWLAGQLTAALLGAKPFLPLPVMGIPGWSPGNENFSFYDDSVVFRSAARPQPKSARPAEAPST